MVEVLSPVHQKEKKSQRTLHLPNENKRVLQKKHLRIISVSSYETMARYQELFSRLNIQLRQRYGKLFLLLCFVIVFIFAVAIILKRTVCFTAQRGLQQGVIFIFITKKRFPPVNLTAGFSADPLLHVLRTSLACLVILLWLIYGTLSWK